MQGKPLAPYILLVPFIVPQPPGGTSRTSSSSQPGPSGQQHLSAARSRLGRAAVRRQETGMPSNVQSSASWNPGHAGVDERSTSVSGPPQADRVESASGSSATQEICFQRFILQEHASKVIGSLKARKERLERMRQYLKQHEQKGLPRAKGFSSTETTLIENYKNQLKNNRKKCEILKCTMDYVANQARGKNQVRKLNAQYPLSEANIKNLILRIY